MSTPTLYLGIDLGTTNSAAAVFDGERVNLVRNAQGTSLTPSVVRIDGRGTASVGQKARRFLESDPHNTRAEFKRLMGTATPLSFAAAKLSRKPEELAAEVLRSLRGDVQDQFGFAPQQAVVSVPALFELPQSAATTAAAKLAGFRRVELIQEPIASALAAGWSQDEEAGYWLVYDLGGGTFDASLLETRDGLLRVVGHDGDNFLGGRDFDWAIVDWALGEVSRERGVVINRADPARAGSIRKLKHAAEEAKIELGRAGAASLVLPEFINEKDGTVDLDLVLDQARLDQLCAPLIDRSLQVCQRLCAAHKVAPAALRRVVLVGGPTMMPQVRRRVAEGLGAPVPAGLDPMTLVAQGAAIYAATAGLDARHAPGEAPPGQAPGRKLWLQFPAMSSDLTPHVVGRLADAAGQGPLPVRLRLLRADGLWHSEDAPIETGAGEGGFVVSVELLPRRPNVFRLLASDKDGAVVPVDPPTITIVQGLTISDPPLSRTIGVALANDWVRVYFERGTPLPARRTFVHHTVETVARGGDSFALRIPIVQGEFEHAHLCRLVGTLLIRNSEIKQSLPAGSQVELTLSLDRGGQLSAQALVPALSQVFEQVAQLLVPDATPEVLAKNLAATFDRLAELRAGGFRRGEPRTLSRLNAVEKALGEIERDVQAAQGGDEDAGQKARRSLIEVDALLEELETDRRWPELLDEARQELAWASRWVAQYGTPHEQRLLAEAGQAVEAAQAARQPTEVARQLRVVTSLRTASFYRSPGAWEQLFERAASEADSATDLVKAQTLVRSGRKALEGGDQAELRRVVEALWKILPEDAESRRLSFESGVR